MFDPNFDPYDELMIARHNITELVKGLNHCSTLLRELGDQHRDLIQINNNLQRRVFGLEIDVKRLKQD